MRIAFFWNNIDINEYTLAVDILVAKRNEFSKQFEAVKTFQLTSPDVQDTFNTVFRFLGEQEIDFAILSHRAAWALDPAKLKILLKMEGVQRAAISVRVGKIQAKAGAFSPKLPYIDEDFIVVNIRRCKELGILEHLNKINTHSHFEDAGGIHVALLSFFEAAVPYGDVYIYSDGSDCQNMFGEYQEFRHPAYLYSSQYGFLSADPSCDERVRVLRKIALKSGAPFLRLPRYRIIWSSILGRAKGLLNRVNYEIEKKWEPIK